MKKILVVTIIALSVIGLQAQVKNYDVIASKTYENGTRTAYLKIEAELDNDIAAIITKELESNPDIHKFSFYAKPDLSKLMFTSNVSTDEQMLVDLLNEAYYDFYSQTGESPKSSSEKQSVNKSSISSKQNDSKELDSNSVLAISGTRAFKKSDFNGKIYRVAFRLEDTPHLDNVKSATRLLEEQGNFEDIFIIDDIHFELSSFEPISADFVIEVFEEFGLKIEEEFIK